MSKAFLLNKISFLAVISLLLSCHLTRASVQEESSVSKRNVGVLIYSRNHGNVSGIPVFTSDPSVSSVMTDPAGHAVLCGVTDADTLFALIHGSQKAWICLDDVDSVLISVKSRDRFRVKGIKRNIDTTPVNEIDNVQEIVLRGNINSLVELLRGLVPGLSISRSPDGGYDTNIRGVRSLYGSSEPLVFLDGVEIGTLSEANQSVNVHDIQSITVDKDGSMYGVRGANGIIKIRSIGEKKAAY